MADMNNANMERITQEVATLLGADKSGHGMEHVQRVVDMAETFAREEGADIEIVRLAALLHDVDDYKLFGNAHADGLINAREILETYAVNEETKIAVLGIIGTMGYAKYLEGVRPSTIEGKIVSDADMCDAIGAMGILRTHAYALSKGDEFFDNTIAPGNESVGATEYRSSKKSHSAQHFFDKLLIIPSILMTEPGRAEGQKRKRIMTQFLRQIFEEENAQDWLAHLDAFEQK